MELAVAVFGFKLRSQVLVPGALLLVSPDGCTNESLSRSLSFHSVLYLKHHMYLQGYLCKAKVYSMYTQEMYGQIQRSRCLPSLAGPMEAEDRYGTDSSFNSLLGLQDCICCWMHREVDRASILVSSASL